MVTDRSSAIVVGLLVSVGLLYMVAQGRAMIAHYTAERPPDPIQRVENPPTAFVEEPPPDRPSFAQSRLTTATQAKEPTQPKRTPKRVPYLMGAYLDDAIAFLKARGFSQFGVQPEEEPYRYSYANDYYSIFVDLNKKFEVCHVYAVTGGEPIDYIDRNLTGISRLVAGGRLKPYEKSRSRYPLETDPITYLDYTRAVYFGRPVNVETGSYL